MIRESFQASNRSLAESLYDEEYQALLDGTLIAKTGRGGLIGDMRAFIPDTETIILTKDFSILERLFSL